MLPTPDESLASLGAFIRASRVSRGINQVTAAKGAKVSRRQLALLEKGGNISVKFLIKVARYLDLSRLPLDGHIEFVSGDTGLNVLELVDTLELLGSLVEHAKGFALQAMLPPSERPKLRDTPALLDFVMRHYRDPEDIGRLAEAMLQISDEAAAGDRAAPEVDDNVGQPRRRRSSKARGK